MTSLMNGTFRSSCTVWLVTYQGAFVIIRSILDWLRCIMAICDLLAHPHNVQIYKYSIELSSYHYHVRKHDCTYNTSRCVRVRWHVSAPVSAACGSEQMNCDTSLTGSGSGEMTNDLLVILLLTFVLPVILSFSIPWGYIALFTMKGKLWGKQVSIFRIIGFLEIVLRSEF
jgi:hypothetical protein